MAFRAVVVKVRVDRTAVARERPDPSRIKERAEAMMTDNCGCETTGKVEGGESSGDSSSKELLPVQAKLSRSRENCKFGWRR